MESSYDLDFGTIRLFLKEVQQYRQGSSFLPKISHDGTRCTDSFLDGSIGVEFRQTAPRTKLLTGFDHDHMNRSLSAQGFDEFLVLFVLAVFGETAQAGATTVERFRALVEAFFQTAVDHGLLQHLKTVLKGKVSKN
jgi:hypothetical protein